MNLHDLPDAVMAALDDDPDQLQRLHTRLTVAAQAQGILDVAYRIFACPIGDLLLAATERGLVKVAFAVQDHDKVLESLAATISPRILLAPARLDPVVRQLEQYFARERRTFDVALDLRLATGFRLDVLAHLQDIAYGTTASYGALAAAAGSPRAYRAAGTACATNPLPVVVPCHRAILSNGEPGRYVGGAEAKQTLLSLETAA